MMIKNAMLIILGTVICIAGVYSGNDFFTFTLCSIGLAMIIEVYVSCLEWANKTGFPDNLFNIGINPYE